jgi:hypothetical protein
MNRRVQMFEQGQTLRLILAAASRAFSGRASRTVR